MDHAMEGVAREVVKTVECRAPGKVILAGEHAVVHGGAAVAASLGLYTKACIHLHARDRGKEEEFLDLHLPQLDVHMTWSLARIRGAFDWPVLVDADEGNVRPFSDDLCKQLELFAGSHFKPELPAVAVAGVVAFLYLYASIVGLLPTTVTVESELPVGAGLGSSAAYCVSLAAGLLALAGKLKCPPNGNWLDVDENSSELVNAWAFQGERIVHGRPSGIDNTVSTFGSIVKFKQSNITRVHQAIPLRMLLTNTRVARNTKTLVAAVGERAKAYPQAMTHIFNAIDAVAETAVSILQSGEIQESEQKIQMDERGDQLADSQGYKTDAEVRLEELVEMNQGLLHTIGVSHSTIEKICQITYTFGLYSKLTGAGGGGCVLTLVPRDTPATLVSKVKSQLEEAGFDCFEAAIGGVGVQVMSMEEPDWARWKGPELVRSRPNPPMRS